MKSLEEIIKEANLLPPVEALKILIAARFENKFNVGLEFMLAETYVKLRDNKFREIYDNLLVKSSFHGSCYSSYARDLCKFDLHEEAWDVLRIGAEICSNFVGPEFYNFAIRYCNLALRKPTSERNSYIFNRLFQEYPENNNVRAVFELRKIEYPFVKNYQVAFDLMLEYIDKDINFTCSRPGNVETVSLLSGRPTSDLANNAGILFDQNEDDLWLLWKNLYISAMRYSDFNLCIQEYEHYGAIFGNLYSLNLDRIYSYPHDYSFIDWLPIVEKMSLKGKVLIISPFSTSIKTQLSKLYDVHNKKFKINIDNLIAIQSPVTLGGDNRSWYEPFQDMKEKISNIDFKYAILGCGGYGHPLLDFLRIKGKCAIYVGGQLQLFFGVYGKRWDNSYFHQYYINNFWIRPRNDEVPVGFESVEKGCYW
jgi:hypothetical protein